MRLMADGWDQTRCQEWAVRRGLGYNPNVASEAPPAVATVNHGRWLAACPNGCGGAMTVHPDLPFWCGECGNSRTGGQSIAVTWPSGEDIARVEDVLILRPIENRNFDPTRIIRRDAYGRAQGKQWTETPLDLAYENLERGLPVPPGMVALTEKFVLADWDWRGLTDEMAGFVR